MLHVVAGFNISMCLALSRLDRWPRHDFESILEIEWNLFRAIRKENVGHTKKIPNHISRGYKLF